VQVTNSTYDAARRRASVRKGRERGCWVYIAADELHKALGDVPEAAPFYRTWGLSGRTVMVKLYSEP
jgi:hypothetical protein